MCTCEVCILLNYFVLVRKSKDVGLNRRTLHPRQVTALPGMKQGGLCARNELHTAQAFERAHLLRQANLASYSPGQRRPRGSACRSFAGHWVNCRWRCACKGEQILTPAIATVLEGRQKWRHFQARRSRRPGLPSLPTRPTYPTSRDKSSASATMQSTRPASYLPAPCLSVPVSSFPFLHLMNSLNCKLVHFIQAEFTLIVVAFCIAGCILWIGYVWTWVRIGLSIAVTWCHWHPKLSNWDNL